MSDKLNKAPIGLHCILAAIYFMALPLTIPVNESGTASYLKYLAIPIAAYYVCTIPFYKKDFHINTVHIALSFYTLTTIFCLFVDDSYESVLITGGYVLNVMLMLCITTRQFNKKEIRLLENAQIVLLCLLCFLGIFGSGKVGERATLEIFKAASDPNYFTGFFVLPLAIALERTVRDKYKIFYALLSALGLYVVFSTGSRGGVLAIAAVLFLSAVVYPKGWFKKILAIVFLIIAFVVAWQIFWRILPESVINRFSIAEVIKSNGTYRFDIWKSMIAEIKNGDWEILFGRGMNSQHTIMLAGRQYAVVAHNHLLQLIYNQGLFGVTAFVLMLVAAYGKNLKKRRYITIALTGMLVLGLSLTFLPSIKAFWNLIMYAAVNNDEQTEEL